jgi:hypothetical protein
MTPPPAGTADTAGNFLPQSVLPGCVMVSG